MISVITYNCYLNGKSTFFLNVNKLIIKNCNCCQGKVMQNINNWSHFLN